MQTKTLMILITVLLVLVGGVALFLSQSSTETTKIPTPEEPTTVVATSTPTTTPETATTSATTTSERGPETVIGTSAGGFAVTAYHFGTGPTELLFIGGIHGGYSWNTSLLAHELIDYLRDNPSAVPTSTTITVIPALNADGLMASVKTTGLFSARAVPTDSAVRTASRFNKNTVDLNRNFDCKWQASGTWQSRTVSGGTSAFSEPESQAIRTYVTTHRPAGVVAWYSAAGGVYGSSCDGDVAPTTLALMNTYAKAADYPAYRSFDDYEVTGDMVDWLAAQDIPAISVLLTTHDNTEWEKNRAGIEAVIAELAQ